ncbi:MAG: radical SAM protein [Acidobacteria bacterium]|nr:radical SAM protein [Acidobacteriota bacterium]
MSFEEKMSEKILLILLPFWSPLIPPMGISCLKSFLNNHGFDVKTVDANVEPRFQELMDHYFNHLKEFLPPENSGNLHNTGHEVLRRHMMAHIHYQNETDYTQLIKQLVLTTFFTPISDPQAHRLQSVIDTFYTRLSKYLLDLLNKENPTILGLSTFTGSLPASLFAFQLAKKNNPGIKTIMGGGIFSGELDPQSPNFQYFLEHTPYIDHIIAGEGETLLLHYLQKKLPHSRRVFTPADINHETLDLDCVPLPDFSDLDIRYYPLLASYSSRSCPFSCAFCSEKILWGKYRKKNHGQIAAELKQLASKYNTQLFLMSDSLLNPTASGLSQTIIESGLSLYWDGYLRVDQAACDPDQTFQWRRGGFYRARLGLESGSPRTLEAMGKKITPTQIKETLSALAQAGIKTTTYWVTGYPGETDADFQQTLDLLEEMKDDIYEADCNPFSYFLTGQVKSTGWASEYQSRTLYPPETLPMLMLQTWELEAPPFREERFHRVNRFADWCRKQGIPNPYSLREIYEADERWKKLHANAVPPLADFINAKNSGITSISSITENKHLKKIVRGQARQAGQAEQALQVLEINSGWEF